MVTCDSKESKLLEPVVPTSDSVSMPRSYLDNHCWQCPQLLTSRFGTIFRCRLFSDEFGGDAPSLDLDERYLIIRHPECLKRDDVYQ